MVETADDLLPLDIAHRAPLLLRRERIRLPTKAPVRLLLLTDLHWTRSRDEKMGLAIEQALDRHRPQIVVVGGDMADAIEGLGLLAASRDALGFANARRGGAGQS